MLDDSIPRSILIVLLILIAAFFSASETAISCCNQIRMKSLAENGNKKAGYVCRFLDNFDTTITVILVGTNIAHMAASTIATVLVVSWLGDVGSVVSTIVLTILIFLFGETIPKNIAKENCDVVVLYFSHVLLFLTIILSPVAKCLTFIASLFSRIFRIGNSEIPTMTETEFQEMIDTIEEEGILEPVERELIQSAVEFSDKLVKEIMIPSEQMVYLCESDSLPDVTKKLLEQRYSRYPVYNQKFDSIVGILRTREFLDMYRKNTITSLTECIQTCLFFEPNTKIDTAFERMASQRCHMAIVRNKEKVIGLLCMEDILEEIVGDIYDEDDPEVNYNA